MRRNPEALSKLIVAIWIMAAISSLTGMGIGIWAIIKLVSKFAG